MAEVNLNSLQETSSQEYVDNCDDEMRNMNIKREAGLILTEDQNSMVKIEAYHDNNQGENAYGNIQLEIKQEDQNEPMFDSHVKQEYDEYVQDCDNKSMASMASMDSIDARALGNVEACLQEDVDMKTEKERTEDIHEQINLKLEEQLAVMQTHLISNKMIETSSTITNTQDGIVESQTTSTLVMEILPMDNTGSLSSNANPEEILPTTNNMDCDDFQLNSITGNILSLEQEAYSLLQAKADEKKPYPCDLCEKSYFSARSLRRHKQIHVSINKRIKGVIQGLKTKIDNKKKLKQEIDRPYKCSGIKSKADTKKKAKPELDRTFKCSTKVKRERSKEDDDSIKKEGYKCTCGQVFRRRIRMETCLKSHNECSEQTCYSCITCSKEFKDKEQLELHRRRLHRKKIPCKFCPCDYSNRKELFKHLQLHQKLQLTEFTFVCEVMKKNNNITCCLCQKNYKNLNEFKCHVMGDHKDPFKCSQCSKEFGKIGEFCHHTKEKHSDIESKILDVIEAFSKLIRAWKCEECSLQFFEPDKFAKHLQQHVQQQSEPIDYEFECEDCKRVFISQKALTSHRRVHHSTESTEEPDPAEKGIMCLECRKVCKDMNALTSHMRLHSPERKFPCKFCDFRFATPEKRKAHAEIHTGDMKYVCFICEYQCSSERRLNDHKLSIKHLNMKEYLLTGKPLIEEEEPVTKGKSKKKKKKESECEKSDGASADNNEISCDICEEKFSSKKKMLAHKETHPFIEIHDPNSDKPSRIFFK